MVNIKVSFSVYSEETLNLDEITSYVGLDPTLTYDKGELIRPGLLRKEYAWIKEFDVVETYEVDWALEKAIENLTANGTIGSLKNIKAHKKIDVVVSNIDDIAPSVFISKSIIDFCSLVGAEIDVDILM